VVEKMNNDKNGEVIVFQSSFHREVKEIVNYFVQKFTFQSSFHRVLSYFAWAFHDTTRDLSILFSSSWTINSELLSLLAFALSILFSSRKFIEKFNNVKVKTSFNPLFIERFWSESA